jgi:hypothetical protein
MKKSLKDIRKAVEIASNIKDISVKTRKRNYIDARMIYYQISKEFTDYGTTIIGMEVDKDHATVMNGLNQFKKIKYIPDIKDLYDKCKYFLSKDFNNLKFSVNMLSDVFGESPSIELTEENFEYVKPCIQILINYYKKLEL